MKAKADSGMSLRGARIRLTGCCLADVSARDRPSVLRWERTLAGKDVAKEVLCVSRRRRPRDLRAIDEMEDLAEVLRRCPSW